MEKKEIYENVKKYLEENNIQYYEVKKDSVLPIIEIVIPCHITEAEER